MAVDNLCLTGKTPLLVRDMLVNFGGHPARNMQKQCILGYGWEFQSKMADHDNSECSPLVESDGTSLQHVNDYSQCVLRPISGWPCVLSRRDKVAPSQPLTRQTVVWLNMSNSKFAHYGSNLSLDKCWAGKTPLLVRDMSVNFQDILPETSKSRACWDMGGNSPLKWLSIFSQYVAP